MIVELKMYGCKCDNCGAQWEDDGRVAFTDETGMESNVDEDSEWHTEDDKHYCAGCWRYNDEDELEISKIAK